MNKKEYKREAGNIDELMDNFCIELNEISSRVIALKVGIDELRIRLKSLVFFKRLPE